jgi:hypothetical protein
LEEGLPKPLSEHQAIFVKLCMLDSEECWYALAMERGDVYSKQIKKAA